MTKPWLTVALACQKLGKPIIPLCPPDHIEGSTLWLFVYPHQKPYLNTKLPFYASITSLLADIARLKRQRRSEHINVGMARVARTGKKFREVNRTTWGKKMVKRQIWRRISDD